MKKIVFCTLTLQPIDKFNAVYSAQQEDIHENSKCMEKLYYPVNAVLANNLEKDDEVKYVIIYAKDPRRQNSNEIYTVNRNKLVSDVEKINEGIGAKIEFVDLETEFEESRDVFQERFINFFEVLEEDAEYYVDMTFGPRPVTMILNTVMEFAEKFFDADIKAMVYGQTSFINGKASEGIACDISGLYYLNNLTRILKADSGAEAIDAFKSLLSN